MSHTMTETTEMDTEAVSKKSTKEVPVVDDEGFFEHSTGDTYTGFFEAKKKDHTIKMHGYGVYKTAEGDYYKGKWENDKFGANEEVTISFLDTSTYVGLFKDWRYAGNGSYTYPDGSVLKGEFSDNAPTGKLTLIDPNQHTWLGKADQGFGWFAPVNHFYDMLENTKELVKRRRGHNINSPEV